MTSHQFLHLIVAMLLSLPGISVSGQTLKIYQIDAEQGDAALVITPAGKTLLIDCGKNGQGDRISSILKKEGKKKIDVFVCTHYHEDHYGSIDDLVSGQGIPVVKAYDRGDKKYLPDEKLNDKDFKAYQETIGKNAKSLRRGQYIAIDPEIKVACIASGGVVKGEKPTSTGSNENDLSVAILITFGSFSYFNGGDIEAPTEKKIAKGDLVTNVEVCKADHHAAETSSDSAFMAKLNPSVIIISNGSDGRYHHPRQSILTLYGNLQPTPDVYQTNKYLKRNAKGGNVPDAYIADPKTVSKDGTFLILVDKNSDQYTLSYRDRKKTYPVKD